MFGWLGRVITGRPWWVVGLWLVAAAVLVLLSPGLTTSGGGASDLSSRYEAVRAQQALEQVFPAQAGQSAVLVVTRRDGGTLGPGDLDQARQLAAAITEARIPRVTATNASAAALSPDKTVLPVHVALASETGTDPSAADEVTKNLRSVADRFTAGTSLTAGLTGGPPLTSDSNKAIAKAEVLLAIGTIGALVLLLALIFRSPVAVLVPLLAVGLVYVSATAVVGLLSDWLGFAVSPYAPALLVVILFGVGVDYTLFLLFRYRELLRKDYSDPVVAVRGALRSVGEAISSSALVVIASFVALLLSDLASNRSLAPTLIVSLAVMLLAGLTLVPAAITLLGERIFWPSRSWRKPSPRPTFAGRLGTRIAGRPRLVLAGGLLLLAVMAIGTAFSRIDYNPNAGLPSSYASVQALARFNQAFPAGALNPVQIVTPAAATDAELTELSQRLSAIPGVAAVRPPNRDPRTSVAEIDVILTPAPYSSAALDLVQKHVRGVAHTGPLGHDTLVGGQTAVAVDTRAATARDFRVVFPLAALFIAIILGALLRALFAPVILLALVGAAFAATFGLSVAVVQGLQGETGLTSAIPVLLYLLVVALGSDYMIIITARLREELHHRPPRAALERAVRHTAPTIAAAGAVLAATFASLLVTGVSVLAQIGLAVVTGILLVALLLACLLVPAATGILGRWFWWPHPPPALDRPEPEPGDSGRSLAGGLDGTG